MLTQSSQMISDWQRTLFEVLKRFQTQGLSKAWFRSLQRFQTRKLPNVEPNWKRLRLQKGSDRKQTISTTYFRKGPDLSFPNDFSLKMVLIRSTQTISESKTFKTEVRKAFQTQKELLLLPWARNFWPSLPFQIPLHFPTKMTFKRNMNTLLQTHKSREDVSNTL